MWQATSIQWSILFALGLCAIAHKNVSAFKIASVLMYYQGSVMREHCSTNTDVHPRYLWHLETQRLGSLRRSDLQRRKKHLVVFSHRLNSTASPVFCRDGPLENILTGWLVSLAVILLRYRPIWWRQASRTRTGGSLEWVRHPGLLP